MSRTRNAHLPKLTTLNHINCYNQAISSAGKWFRKFESAQQHGYNQPASLMRSTVYLEIRYANNLKNRDYQCNSLFKNSEHTNISSQHLNSKENLLIIKVVLQGYLDLSKRRKHRDKLPKEQQMRYRMEIQPV